MKAFVFSQWQWLFFLLARFGIKVWQLGKAGGPTETARASMGSRGEMELDSWARLDAQGTQEFTRKIQKWYCSSYRMASETNNDWEEHPREKECHAQTRTQDDSSAFIHRYLYVGPKLPAPYFCFAKGHVLEPCQL